MITIADRRQSIIDFISRHGYASVNDLADRFNVTGATIRADLRYLEEKGKVVRSHGGAITATSAVMDLKEDEKGKSNVDKKRAIAAAAARMVSDPDSLIIASGSTMCAFADAINHSLNLNIATPSIRIAMMFVDNPNATVLQLGGVIYGNTLSTRGSYAEAGLDLFQCNKLFFGVEGFDVNSGLTCATIEEANLTRKMIKCATKVIVLADSSKYCRRGFGKICNLQDVDILVTDSGLSEEARTTIEALGVEVVIA
ncbi:MAG: DeoR/GlpR family DNA-binding transcription regulator [Bacteroidales bacterium]|nr:DeoR/GlpR family DNA-binding transcription regulator [Bacteroidales bacterium]